ncbi:MAG: hypothetical protein IJO67_10295, partial [Clostridia bacterium]|nr:hypothetical protein [Clostridia bacterium]
KAHYRVWGDFRYRPVDDKWPHFQEIFQGDLPLEITILSAESLVVSRFELYVDKKDPGEFLLQGLIFFVMAGDHPVCPKGDQDDCLATKTLEITSWP